MSTMLPAVLAAILVAGLARAVTGFGFALLAVPLLSLHMAVPNAVALTIVLQVAMVPRDVFVSWRRLDRSYLLRLLVWALPAIPLGQLALLSVPAEGARMALAGLVLTGVGMRAAPPPLAGLLRRMPVGVAGFLAGFMGGLAAMPGPPVVLHALSRPDAPDRTRATLLLFFGALSICSLPVLVQSGAADAGLGWLALSALPVLLLADSLGRRLSGYISVSAYHNLSAGLLCLSACLAVYPVLR